MHYKYRYKFSKWHLGGTAILGILLVLLLNIFLSYIFNSSNLNHPTLKNNQWFYKLEKAETYAKLTGESAEASKEANWRRCLDFGKSITTSEINIIRYKTTLSNNEVPDPCIVFQTNDQAFDFYLNNKLIYSFGSFEKLDGRHSLGSPVHLISLPKNYQGKELEIVMKSVTRNRVGLVRNIELDSKSNHIILIFNMSISILILGCLDVVIGAACMLIGVVRRLGRKALFTLGFSFISVGLWSISENSLTQLFNLRPVFWYYTASVSFYLIPISIYKFIKDISRANKQVLNFLIEVHLLILAISITLDIIGVEPLINTLIYHYIFTGISYITCIVVGTMSYLKGNKRDIIYILGLLIFGLFGAYDILGWYFQAIPWKINLAPWGMFIFQLGLIYVLIDYLQTIQERFIFYRKRIMNKNNKLREKDKQIVRIMEYDKIRMEFFANVSHELRTPLNIISSTIQLIKMYNSRGVVVSSEKSFEKYLNMMSQNCNRLMKLVNNIIDITKIDSGFYRLELKNMNIVSVVENITMSIEEYAKNKGISLVFDTNAEEKIIACDPDAIERVMLNLLSNSIKFSKIGDSINVLLKDEGNKVTIVVEDTGIGIPQENLSSIFDRFMQVDKSFTRQQEGSGIGLTLVKSLVEMHNGVIVVESELNKGSKFTVSLPAVLIEYEGLTEVLEDSMSQGKVDKVSVEFSDIYNE